MDQLLEAYGADSSSSDESVPSNQLKTIPTGTVQRVSFNSTSFDELERQYAHRLNKAPSSKSVPTSNKRPRSSPSDSQPSQTASVKPQPSSSSHLQTKDDGKKSKKQKSNSEPFVPNSVLHLSNPTDYLGRSWTEPNPSARTFAELEQYTPYIPKQSIKTLTNAHAGGVSVIKFSPSYGHILLSAGMDGTARIWQTETKKLARDYTGHSKTVRDVGWQEDGHRFLTAAYDRSVKLWDVQTGKVMGNYALDGLPSCVKFVPDTGGNEFLVACGDRKILQIDVRDAREVVQTYDQHMAGVNAIEFVEDNRRFVSSADDKMLRVWDYGIPVVIKYISDPYMHSMPVVKLHPNRKWLACQSMDNQVTIYSCKDRFKYNSKKSFKGHLVAGYACGLTFSADGRFMGSGDSMGRLFFWDWKTTRMFRTVQAHKGVCIDIDWHPVHASLVASCGWDGSIQFWD